MIEVRDLVKRYGAHLAVDHLSFSVPDGQIFGFLGPNGADIREDLFHACAQAGLPILALRRDALTLEDIFLRLTSDDPGQQPGVSRTPDTSAAAPTQEGEQAQ